MDALTAALPDETPHALAVSTEDAASPTDACTTLRPAAAASNVVLAESAAEPSGIVPAALVIVDVAASGDAAEALCAPFVVSVAVATRFATPREMSVPTAVSADSDAKLTEPSLTPYPMAVSTDVAGSDEGVATARAEAPRSPAAPTDTFVTKAVSAASAVRCSVPRATPNPLAVSEDVPTRFAVPNIELAAVSAASPPRDATARAVCVTVVEMVEVAVHIAEVSWMRTAAAARVDAAEYVAVATAVWLAAPVAVRVTVCVAMTRAVRVTAVEMVNDPTYVADAC